ncbi:transglutaminase-like domain-containing protein [Maribellus sp. YY47]|uniref:transglutaminase-like domain-containing protein n=1 Tax=Maribellus sp. YY47 TaxID=2929486 RepID=UPI002001D0A2|nr:transglutaminase-like domain-containing protein [Maribellus sp. YY47]MCK3684929.1 transglutaminase-like domain-containing protein [Maribellus sp. YY47]
MDKNRLDALINLLDDPDEMVYALVEKALLKSKGDIIPMLEKKWESSFDEHSQERIENIIQHLQFKETKRRLKKWLAKDPGERSLVNGFCHVDRFQYPDLNPLNIQAKIETLRKSIWLELNNSLTILEKTTILNHFLFNINGFAVNLSNPHSPQNCFLNQLLDTKKGNPVSMSIFYTIVARMLEIPAHLVDFPKNPLVAIVDAELAKKVHGAAVDSDVLFYINPSNKGAVTSRKEIEYHLKKNDYLPMYDYTEPKPDTLFIVRLLESMQEAYQSVGFQDKEEKIKQLLRLF